MEQPGNYDPATFRPLTFHDAVPAFGDGADTPRAYLERCLETIERREPEVQAWVTTNPEGARRAADESTARHRAGRPRSPIDGMPIGIKDLLLTRDMPTEMGSPLFRGHHPKQDSASVQALRAAGAVILGKTVTTELGMSHPGPTTNPFHPGRTPGGSSSGSAAAVGACMVPAAIGTQVVGSVIRPAAFCANHAIKPTYGALNRGERQGFSQSHLGIHAGSQRDMWLVAWEIARRAGGDPGHPGLHGEPEPRPATPPRRLVLMHSEGWAATDERTLDAFERLLRALRDRGVEVLSRGDNPLVEAFERSVADGLAQCRDICGFEQRWQLENLAAQDASGLSESITSRLLLAREMTLDDYREVLLRRELARRAFAAIPGIGECVISLSSAGPAPPMGNALRDGGIAHSTGLPGFNAPSSLLGAPAITIPLLAVGGLPVGAQVMGQPHADAALVGIARWLAETLAPVAVA